MKLEQQQMQQLSQQQLQSIKILQMSNQQLDAYLQELYFENPLIEIDEPSEENQDDFDAAFSEMSSSIDFSDYATQSYTSFSNDDFDPLLNASCEGGFEESLSKYLLYQLNELPIEKKMLNMASYLVGCIDEKGYFSDSLTDVVSETGWPYCDLEEALHLVQSLEPVGVGARSLSECLAIQLEERGSMSIALSIVKQLLPQLAKRHYREIAAKLNVPVEQVFDAECEIRELTPYPGLPFSTQENVPYISADMIVEAVDGKLTVRSSRGEKPTFHVSIYYRTLLENASDRELHTYLTAKLHQAENIRYAVEQRTSTLLRCVQKIVERQQAFFSCGPQSMRPLRICDIAEALNLHESTVCRAVHDKYLLFSGRIYPLSFFFSRKAATKESAESFSGMAARGLLRRLIDEENPSKPLSDQKLSSLMAEQGCPISRRTITKYRAEMMIPDISGRKRI